MSNSKWWTIVGVLLTAGGAALEVAAQRHLVAAGAFSVGLALTAFGKALGGGSDASGSGQVPGSGQ